MTLNQESEYDTDPFHVDTDRDGLSDVDEIFVYGTSPINEDTDFDGMSDATEINNGLNPLSADTDEDGTPDSEEIITQRVDIEAFGAINLEENLVDPSVEITGPRGI